MLAFGLFVLELAMAPRMSEARLARDLAEVTPEMERICSEARSGRTPPGHRQCLLHLVSGARLRAALRPRPDDTPSAAWARPGERALPGDDPHPIHRTLTVDAVGLRGEFRHAVEIGDARRALGVAALLPPSVREGAADIARLLGSEMPPSVAELAATCARGTCFVQVADWVRYVGGVAPASAEEPALRADAAVVVFQDELPPEFSALGVLGLSGLVFREGRLVAIGENEHTFYAAWLR